MKYFSKDIDTHQATRHYSRRILRLYDLAVIPVKWTICSLDMAQQLINIDSHYTSVEILFTVMNAD